MSNKLHVGIYHNILWSKYKGVVFSALSSCAKSRDIECDFFQIAETESDRVGLSGVDLRYHAYPYRLIFKGAYDDAPAYRRCSRLFMFVLFGSRFDFMILPGYHKIEYWFMLFAAILRRIPRGVFCDSTINDRAQNIWKSLAKRYFFSQCHGFFCYGERSKQYLMIHGAPAQKIFHRVQAAALPFSYDASVVPVLRSIALAQSDRPIILYVGRLSPEKNLKLLFLAFERVTMMYPRAELNLVGNGPQRNELEAIVDEMGLSAKIRFLGGKTPEQLAEHYLSASALVLPSTSEPWGLVVNEALSYGCPVIVSDACGCVPELVINGSSGFSFRSGDLEDMVNAMTALLEQDKDGLAMSEFCLDLISGFTPRHAAMQIIHGVREMVQK